MFSMKAFHLCRRRCTVPHTAAVNRHGKLLDYTYHDDPSDLLQYLLIPASLVVIPDLLLRLEVTKCLIWRKEELLHLKIRLYTTRNKQKCKTLHKNDFVYIWLKAVTNDISAIKRTGCYNVDERYALVCA